MKKLHIFFFLVVVFSICLPCGSVAAPKIRADASIRAYADNAPAADYYVNQTNESRAYFENLKIEEKPGVFKKTIDFAFSDIQKKFLTVFYPPYLCACSLRCINLSKLKKLTIYFQTVL
ncbi:MAG: hypothetical protein J6V73_07565 [Spirochaetaceae bacterium]|nr:hypothetical protein [Spirochaetaceae bacterium]